VYKAHATEHVDDAQLNWHYGYPFRNYDFSQANDSAAEKFFQGKFDEHVSLQDSTMFATFPPTVS